MKSHFVYSIACVIVFASCNADKITAPVIPAGDTVMANLSYATPEVCILDLYLPVGRTDTTPVIILIHGGGWNSGSKGELAFMAKAFQKKGFAVANMDYRLSPQSDDNFKMQLDDVQALATWLQQHADGYLFSSSDFFIAGHSAGGHLALSYAYTRNENHLIKAAAGIAAPANLFNMAYYNPVLYAQLLTPYLGVPLDGNTTERYKAASPYYQANSGSVPTILFQGGLDLIVNKDQANMLNARLNELGVEHKLKVYDLAGHDWWTNGEWVNNTVEETCWWFRGH